MSTVSRQQFVVDNSVVMSWMFEDETSSYSDKVLGSLIAAQALVPQIWPLEVANVLAVAERQKRIAEGDSIRFLALLESLPIRIISGSNTVNLKNLLSLARDFRLSAYDASYLELAITLAVPLATTDKSLRRAARQAKVAIWNKD